MLELIDSNSIYGFKFSKITKLMLQNLTNSPMKIKFVGFSKPNVEICKVFKYLNFRIPLKTD
jgi:hypothetical protein